MLQFSLSLSLSLTLYKYKYTYNAIRASVDHIMNSIWITLKFIAQKSFLHQENFFVVFSQIF